MQRSSKKKQANSGPPRKDFVVDPQDAIDLEAWADEECRSVRNLTSVIVRRAVSEWRSRRQQGQQGRRQD